MSDTNPRGHVDPDAPEDSEYEDVLLEGHDYDGIREYDNPIPPWLSLIFIGTIVWSLFYVVAINLGYIDRYEDDLEEGMEALATMRSKAKADTPELTPKLLASAADSQKRIQAGGKLFKKRCASCHTDDGGGNIGPNLTDRYWIHGGTLMDIYTTIDEGVLEKQMPAWGEQMAQREMVNLTAFVRSLQGTTPSDPKKPEGEKFIPGGGKAGADGSEKGGKEGAQKKAKGAPQNDKGANN